VRAWLSGQQRAQHTCMCSFHDQAERTTKLGSAAMAVREARGNSDLRAKRTQLLGGQPTRNLLIAPRWLTVRAERLAARAPYPEARVRVAARWAEQEAGRGG
jgi:hypothetical protein